MCAEKVLGGDGGNGAVGSGLVGSDLSPSPLVEEQEETVSPLDLCPLCWGDEFIPHSVCQGRGCDECEGTGSEPCPHCEADIVSRYYQAEVALYGRCAKCWQSGAAVAIDQFSENPLCFSCEAEDRYEAGDDDFDPYDDDVTPDEP